MTMASSSDGSASMMSISAHDDDVDEAAEEPGDHAEHDADDERQRHDDAADQQR